MNPSVREPSGVPFAVRVRAYIPHALTALVAIVAYLLTFAFLAGKTVGAAAELRRTIGAPHNEIVLAGEANGPEPFLYLKNYAASGKTGENALSDVLMILPGFEYYSNNIDFCGTLESGTCAVSANVAAKYGLRVGDSARIMGTGKSFRVARLLPAQDGLDEDYLHEGLIVLSYDEELLDRSYMYISFVTDGDAYRSLDTLTFVEDIQKESIGELILCAFVALFCAAAAIAVSEYFLFRARREDYKTLSYLGIGTGGLFVRVFGECILRYVLPLIAVSAIFEAWYYAYTAAYYIPVACFTGVTILLSAIYSFIVIRRLYYVKSK